jgi:hypothetical protein
VGEKFPSEMPSDTHSLIALPLDFGAIVEVEFRQEKTSEPSWIRYEEVSLPGTKCGNVSVAVRRLHRRKAACRSHPVRCDCAVVPLFPVGMVRAPFQGELYAWKEITSGC